MMITTTTGAPMTTPSTERALPTLAAVPTQRSTQQPITKKAPKATTIRVEVKTFECFGNLTFDNYEEHAGFVCRSNYPLQRLFLSEENEANFAYLWKLTKFPNILQEFTNAKHVYFWFPATCKIHTKNKLGVFYDLLIHMWQKDMK